MGTCRRSVRLAIIPGFALLSLACATDATRPPARAQAVPCAAPAPATMHISTEAALNLPDDVAKGLKAPVNHLKMKFTLDAESEQVESSPQRSKYRATARITIGDVGGKSNYLEMSSTQEGEANGSPDAALWSVFGRFTNTAEVLDAASRGAWSTSRPASP